MVMRILIMAGGTGGHVFPALAVAETLRGRGAEVVWLGTRRGLEARVAPAAGFDVDWLRVAGLRGKGAVTWLLAPLSVAVAVGQAVAVMLHRRPMVVLGMGGYATGPGGVAAWLLRIPLLIHEQNAIAGLTNRLLSRLATRVLAAFPGAFPQRRRALLVGNPVRAALTALPVPEERMRNRGGALRVLVIGGSLGERDLNELMPRALQRLAPERRPVVRHQTGERHLEDARRAYEAAGVSAESIVPFIDDMAAAYAWADLVVSRAGALTVAELAATGVGAVLVPYPHAADEHQTANARYLADNGAAILISQERLTPEGLADLLDGFTAAGQRRRLIDMATAARRLARPDAAERIASVCMEAAHA